jgi:hypothetical protein
MGVMVLVNATADSEKGFTRTPDSEVGLSPGRRVAFDAAPDEPWSTGRFRLAESGT